MSEQPVATEPSNVNDPTADTSKKDSSRQSQPSGTGQEKPKASSTTKVRESRRPLSAADAVMEHLRRRGISTATQLLLAAENAGEDFWKELDLDGDAKRMQRIHQMVQDNAWLKYVRHWYQNQVDEKIHTLRDFDEGSGEAGPTATITIPPSTLSGDSGSVDMGRDSEQEGASTSDVEAESGAAEQGTAADASSQIMKDIREELHAYVNGEAFRAAAQEKIDLYEQQASTFSEEKQQIHRVAQGIYGDVMEAVHRWIETSVNEALLDAILKRLSKAGIEPSELSVLLQSELPSHIRAAALDAILFLAQNEFKEVLFTQTIGSASLAFDLRDEAKLRSGALAILAQLLERNPHEIADILVRSYQGQQASQITPSGTDLLLMSLRTQLRSYVNSETVRERWRPFTELAEAPDEVKQKYHNSARHLLDSAIDTVLRWIESMVDVSLFEAVRQRIEDKSIGDVDTYAFMKEELPRHIHSTVRLALTDYLIACTMTRHAEAKRIEAELQFRALSGSDMGERSVGTEWLEKNDKQWQIEALQRLHQHLGENYTEIAETLMKAHVQRQEQQAKVSSQDTRAAKSTARNQAAQAIDSAQQAKDTTADVTEEDTTSSDNVNRHEQRDEIERIVAQPAQDVTNHTAQSSTSDEAKKAKETKKTKKTVPPAAKSNTASQLT
jgi:hypothetical protein